MGQPSPAPDPPLRPQPSVAPPASPDGDISPAGGGGGAGRSRAAPPFSRRGERSRSASAAPSANFSPPGPALPPLAASATRARRSGASSRKGRRGSALRWGRRARSSSPRERPGDALSSWEVPLCSPLRSPLPPGTPRPRLCGSLVAAFLPLLPSVGFKRRSSPLFSLLPKRPRSGVLPPGLLQTECGSHNLQTTLTKAKPSCDAHTIP